MEAAAPAAALGKYIQLDAVADVKTRFSSGCSSVQELANIAQHRGIDVVIYSDRDRMSLEYGIFPFERIVKKKKEQYSILTSGASAYLAEINTNDKTFPETLLVPAVESAPFYYWTGNLVDKNLTAHNWDKHLLIVGLNSASEYERLPVLNSNFSTKYIDRYGPSFLVLAVLFLISAGLFYKRVWRKTSFFFTVVFLLLAVNNHPFKSSPFDQYGGDKGIAPYQETIDYAVAHDAMVFWNHLESTAGVGKKDSVGLDTPPHPRDLLLSKNYTGFEAVYDGKIHVTDPGREWDQVLLQYVRGERAHPVWGYGGNDFQCEGENGRALGGVRTILLVKEKSRKAVLDAMRRGRMYAVKQPDEFRLSLDNFTISDKAKAAGREAVMGDELVTKNFPELKVNLRLTNGIPDWVELSVIRDGEVVKKEIVTMPYELVWRDMNIKREGKVYYRLKAEVSTESYLISNPIFVKFSDAAPQVASVAPEPKPSSIADKAPERPKPPSPPAPPQAPSAKTAFAETVDIRPPAVPDVPKISLPEASSETELDLPSAPQVSEPAPAAPATEPEKEQKFVVALIDGVTLKKGPGVKFPQTATARKGERLLLLRKLKSLHNGKPWLEIKKDRRKMYVWGGLVKFSE